MIHLFDMPTEVVKIEGLLHAVMAESRSGLIDFLDRNGITSANLATFKLPTGRTRYVLMFPGTKATDCPFFDRSIETDMGMIVIQTLDIEECLQSPICDI